jgi:PAS domain S-box-containing protein
VNRPRVHYSTRLKMNNWFNGRISRLHKYKPPFGDWRFWAIQVLSIGIAIAHWAFEGFGSGSEFGRLYFVPVILLVVPVVIAALYFGSVGAFTTALWVVLISVPNLIIEHSGLERVGEAFQMVVLLAIAVFMGTQVDKERNLRHKVEDASVALTSSETKYHSLFSSSPIAILALDRNNTILDANPSAGALFGKSPEVLKNTSVTDLLRTRNEKGQFIPLQKDGWWESTLVINSKNGSEVYLEPKLTQLSDSQGNPIVQVLLRDVTEERHKQAGLEAYTAYVIQAQEDERQHIARELHDETLQNLALLCRQLKGIDTTDKALPLSVVEDLSKSSDIAEKAVKDLRNFTRRLRPPILDDLGLVASIRRLVLDFTDRTGMKGQLKIDGEERRLPQDVEVSMFRIAQEALWNVEHHSKASNASVVITFGKETTSLTISDDGVGFMVPLVLESMSTFGKLGLLGMKERAELFGGDLEIQSSPGKGTVVNASFPVVNNPR